MLGQPDAYCSPAVSCIMFAVQVAADMVFHQYVPGVFPYSHMVLRFGHHHAEHHFFNLQPLGSGFDRPPGGNQSLSNDFERWLVGWTESEAWTSFRRHAENLELLS